MHGVCYRWVWSHIGAGIIVERRDVRAQALSAQRAKLTHCWVSLGASTRSTPLPVHLVHAVCTAPSACGAPCSALKAALRHACCR